MEQFNGVFNIIAKMPVLGRQKGNISFTVDGDSVTGSTTFMRNLVPMENVVIDGNSFSGTADAPSPTGKMRMEISGTVDGDAISGEIKSPLGTFKYSGERA